MPQHNFKVGDKVRTRENDGVFQNERLTGTVTSLEGDKVKLVTIIWDKPNDKSSFARWFASRFEHIESAEPTDAELAETAREHYGKYLEACRDLRQRGYAITAESGAKLNIFKNVKVKL